MAISSIRNLFFNYQIEFIVEKYQHRSFYGLFHVRTENK
ncbi:hypothetical protein AQPE_0715 [Aquipluma nitroreducens]|uniref:Uncharacterized protein n=1 Tax=Aquipluma nitroreducens TaxID=2010828 RepID=A0A5K7S522_9BACT|nr:hypothetical protein AQPE_0715 [Aquipluma nitroreducens]